MSVFDQPPNDPGWGNGHPPVAGAPPTNTMAVLALVFAFVFPPLAIVFGLIARDQIRRTGEAGRGLATAGLVIGIVFLVLALVPFAIAAGYLTLAGLAG